MFPHWFRSVPSAAAFLSVLFLAGCSDAKDPPAASAPRDTAAAASDAGNNDPFESVNRQIFAVDLALNDYLLTPIARAYRDDTPQFFQMAVNNALRNLRSPAIFANDLLEGNTKQAGQTLTRIYLNTLVGVGGLIDVAATQNLPFHEADFGATLGAWGVPTGPYLVLPLLGPSNPRDGVGVGVDSFLDPFNVKTRAAGLDDAQYYRLGGETVDRGSRNIDEIEEQRRSSLDFYAAVRSLYQQKRAADVATAKNPNAPAQPNVSYDQVEPSGPVPTNPQPTSDSTKAR